MTTPVDSSSKRLPTPWLTVLLMSVLLFAIYYTYDLISSAAPLFPHNATHAEVTHLKLGTMNALVFLPGVVLAFATGILIDRFGVKRVGVGVGLLFCLGAIVMAIYMAHVDSPKMLWGRFLFGLSMEPAMILGQVAILRVVTKEHATLAFGFFSSAGRLGSLLADEQPIWIGLASHQPCAASSNIVIAWRPVEVLSIVALVVTLIHYFFSIDNGPDRNNRTTNFTWNTFRGLGRPYWWLVAICVSGYVVVFVMRTFGQHSLVEMISNRCTASQVMGLTSFIPLILSPMFVLLDKKPLLKPSFVLVGLGLLLISQVAIVAWPTHFYLGYSILGLAYSTFPVIWASLKGVVPPEKMGLANGLMTSLQNAGIAAFLVLTGAIYDAFRASSNHFEGHYPGNWLMLAVAACGLFAAGRYYRGTKKSAPSQRLRIDF